MPHSPSLPATLIRPMAIDQLPPPAHRLLAAMRAAVAIHHSGQCPRPRLTAILGNDRAAATWIMLLNSVSAAWPEPMAVYPPCCRCMTHDEAVLIELVSHAAAFDRPAFDRLICEMIDDDGRELIYAAARRFVAGFAGT